MEVVQLSVRGCFFLNISKRGIDMKGKVFVRPQLAFSIGTGRNRNHISWKNLQNAVIGDSWRSFTDNDGNSQTIAELIHRSDYGQIFVNVFDARFPERGKVLTFIP
jgi:hypothetical protein